MLINKIGYSYNDLTLVPAIISEISSRSQCNPFVKDNFLPIFTAPMASICNEENIDNFLDNGIIPIIPRNISIEKRIELMNKQQWIALSLNEFNDLFINKYEERINDLKTAYFICVDIANGHMHLLYNICRVAKILANKHKYKLTIMTGNIANPDTYEWICKNFIKYENLNKEPLVDFIRVGIGGGSGCITTSNVSAHYPQASLIDECYKIKKQLLLETITEHGLTSHEYDEDMLPKIVADGGIRNYDHVIKALALGADYVMIGSLFAQCIESAGIKLNKNINQKISLRFPIERYRDFELDEKGNWWAYYTDKFKEKLLEAWQDDIDKYKDQPVGNTTTDYLIAVEKYNKRKESLSEKKFIGPIDVKFFGMASADGQKSIDGKKTKTAEGITKYLPVKYTLQGWVNNMTSYLRSAMSYTNCFTLKDFIGKPMLIINSISEIHAVNK